MQIVDDTTRHRPRPAPTAPCRCCPPEQLAAVRNGERLISTASRTASRRLRVVGPRRRARPSWSAPPVAGRAVGVTCCGSRPSSAAPIAVLLMASLTYWIVGRTLRPVAGLRTRRGDHRRRAGRPAAAGAGRAGRDPPTGRHLERHARPPRHRDHPAADVRRRRRARTAFADRVGAVQLEVAQRLGPSTDWAEVIDDVLADVDRLERLVDDLLALARPDESPGPAAARVRRRRRIGARLAAAVHGCAGSVEVRVPPPLVRTMPCGPRASDLR